MPDIRIQKSKISDKTITTCLIFARKQGHKVFSFTKNCKVQNKI